VFVVVGCVCCCLLLLVVKIKMSTRLIQSFVALRQASWDARDCVYRSDMCNAEEVLKLLECCLYELDLLFAGESWQSEPETASALLACRKSNVLNSSKLRPSICVDALKLFQAVFIPLEKRAYVAKGTLCDMKSSLEFVYPLVRSRSYNWVLSLRQCVMRCDYILCSYAFDMAHHLCWESSMCGVCVERS
jgi:hypothetical protein